MRIRYPCLWRASASTLSAAIKCRRYTIIDNRKKDEWSGFADLLANLIEKYAAVLDIENLPEPPVCLDDAKKEIENKSKLFEDSVDKTDIA